MKWTVLGASGFIGRHLLAALSSTGDEVSAPTRRQIADRSYLGDQSLGTVLYCIGLTADFRQRPHETVHAHVCLLNDLLASGLYEGLVYLSSTRVYAGAPSTAEEAPLQLSPAREGSLYDASKLAGEALCLHGGRDAKVVRLSNVYGHNPGSRNFLDSVLQDAASHGRVLLRTAPSSSKDYISVHSAVRSILEIARSGTASLYNVASGINRTHAAVAAALERLGIEVGFAPEAAHVEFPVIDVSRLHAEFGSGPDDFEGDLALLLNAYKNIPQA